MNDFSRVMGGALTQMRVSMTEVATKAGLPAMSVQEAAQVLGAPPSIGLAAAMEHARKREEGPITYTAANGEMVRRDRGPIVASAAVADEARERLAATDTAIATRPHPAKLAEWLYRLAQSVERAPSEEELDCAVKQLAIDLQDLPACLFTDVNRRKVAVILIYWPAYSKLAQCLNKLKASLLAERKQLEEVVAAGASTPHAAPAPPARVRERPSEEAIREVRAKVQPLEDAAPPRKKKRWTPPPVGPVRSVEDQLAALKDWKWQPKSPADDAPQANAANVE